VSKVKSPPEKKRLSYLHDRRNIYGENDKSSRKNIARGKQRSHQDERRSLRQTLSSTFAGAVDDDLAESAQSEALIRGKINQRKRFRKVPDAPLGEFLKRRNLRRSRTAQTRLDNFAELYAIAIKQWPREIALPVRRGTGVYIVDGLTALDKRVSRRWVGHRGEVLMVNLHWAITCAVQAAFEHSDGPVRSKDLDVERVRSKFERDLRAIRKGTIPTWTSDDRMTAARYFRHFAARVLLTAPQQH
jgi:hypothetical protein